MDVAKGAEEERSVRDTFAPGEILGAYCDVDDCVAVVMLGSKRQNRCELRRNEIFERCEEKEKGGKDELHSRILFLACNWVRPETRV